jgi:hypothetical protein
VIIANSQGGSPKDNSTKIVAPAVSIPASKIIIVDEE